MVTIDPSWLKPYVAAVRTHRWVLDSVESYLETEPDGAHLEVSRLARASTLARGRPLSDQQILVAFSALAAIRVLSRKRNGFVFDKGSFDASAATRSVARAVLDGIDDQKNLIREAELCVSLPPTLTAAAAAVIREVSPDLRAGLLDVITSAQESLVIASPFWDSATAGEIRVLVENRLAKGLRCVVLGRFSSEIEKRAVDALLKLKAIGDCTVLSWFEDSSAATETFHFKVASADRGKVAYLGSANMTRSSLRSRMELGVLLRGQPAAELDAVLTVVLSVAKPVEG